MDNPDGIKHFLSWPRTRGSSLWNDFVHFDLVGSRISKVVKLATLVEGDSKALFSLATTPRCRGGHYSLSWIAALYPWSIPYNAECKARWHQVPFFESLVWLNPGLNPGLPDHKRMSNCLYMYVCARVRSINKNNINNYSDDFPG